MKNNSLVKIPVIVLGIAVIASLLWSVFRPQPQDQVMAPSDSALATTPTPPAIDNTTPAAPMVCYYASTKTARGFYDRAWITMNVQGQNISGQYHSSPAEKDASVGTFTGTIDTQDPNVTSKIATVWSDTQAEGMQSKNELLIVYDNLKASVGFGEMVQTGTGTNTYAYKDKTKITYGTPIPKVDCAMLTEITSVETYIKNNIATIIGTTATPTVGGTWSTTSINVDSTTHIASVSYSDGHITKKGTIEYTFDPTAGTVTVTKFTS